MVLSCVIIFKLAFSILSPKQEKGANKKPAIDYNDLRGNFIIKTDQESIKLIHIHPEDNSELDTYSGKTVSEIIEKISARCDINTSHALYLGKELMKAEIALKTGKEYVQDSLHQCSALPASIVPVL